MAGLRWRPYFFEIFIAVNFILIQALLWNITRAPLQTFVRVILTFVPAMAVQTAIGVGIRAVVAWRQGKLHPFLEVIRSPAWLTDTLRIIVSTALWLQTYAWIKLAIPLLHPRLFDQELWNLDLAIFLGHSPNVLLLDLFSHPAILRGIDWTYANVFLASITIAGIYFTSSPSRRVRVAFTDSNTTMWIIGAWLYVLVPSLGPAYRFPEVWLPLSAMFANTQQLQRLLMSNYQIVLQYKSGAPRPVNILFGIAAFPSLHVAFQMLVFLWMRRLWRYGEIVFGLFTLIIFLGSIVTGWHYLIDGIAGVMLAVICYAVAAREHRMARWLAICRRPGAFLVA